MKKTFKTYAACAAALAAIVAVPAVAEAITITDEVMVGLNGNVVIGEFSGLFQNQLSANNRAKGAVQISGYYRVDVLNPDVAISAFAVSTDAMSASPNREGWGAANISAAQWDTSFSGTVGSYASLFGTTESRVNYYFDFNEGPTNFITDASDQDQISLGEWNPIDGTEFLFGGPVGSDFVAIGPNGQIVDQSRRTIPVPDASNSLGLLCLSLGTMGWVFRKRS